MKRQLTPPLEMVNRWCINSYMRTGKPQVLYVGNEPSLSKASSELLRTVGYATRVCLPRNLAVMLKNIPLKAVILCATINADEAEQIIRVVNALQPGVPVISIHVGLLGDNPHPASYAVVDALAGPNALIAAVNTVVKLRASAR